MTVPPHILSTHSLYDGWTTLRSVQLRLESGEIIQREVEDHGNAVAVLPFDPVRRTALLIRGLRAPALLSAGRTELGTLRELFFAAFVSLARTLPRIIGSIGSLKRRGAMPPKYDASRFHDNPPDPRLAAAGPRLPPARPLGRSLAAPIPGETPSPDDYRPVGVSTQDRFELRPLLRKASREHRLQ
jgi:hypothetical protein